MKYFINYDSNFFSSSLANQQKLISENFTDLIGTDQHGWGLSHHGLLWHNGQSRVYLKKSFELFESVLVGIQFDGDARTLSYTINNQPMGIAFHSIPRNLPIYPAVSSTSAQSTMILKHACQICSSLREFCLKTIKSAGFINKIPSHLITTQQ
jgi:SPRY domain-containing SOCS box protein 3